MQLIGDEGLNSTVPAEDRMFNVCQLGDKKGICNPQRSPPHGGNTNMHADANGFAQLLFSASERCPFSSKGWPRICGSAVLQFCSSCFRCQRRCLKGRPLRPVLSESLLPGCLIARMTIMSLTPHWGPMRTIEEPRRLSFQRRSKMLGRASGNKGRPGRRPVSGSGAPAGCLPSSRHASVTGAGVRGRTLRDSTGKPRS